MPAKRKYGERCKSRRLHKDPNILARIDLALELFAQGGRRCEIVKALQSLNLTYKKANEAVIFAEETFAERPEKDQKKILAKCERVSEAVMRQGFKNKDLNAVNRANQTRAQLAGLLVEHVKMGGEGGDPIQVQIYMPENEREKGEK